MKLIVLDGVRYLAPDIQTLQQYLPAIKGDILRMRQVHTGPQKWFERRDFWKIKEHHGLLTVELTGPPQPGVRKQKLVRKYTIESTVYGLLVELSPSGYALFMPGEDGELVYEKTITNDKENQDPPGCIGQGTYRTGWCYESVPASDESPGYEIEQIKRVDQGYVAYEGDPTIEEVTEAFYYTGLTTYENIPIVHHWKSVTPGPPPESFCGYSWSPPIAYGGEEADRHDEVALFYWVETSGDNLKIAWWPEEFSQYIEIEENVNEEGCCYRGVDVYDPAWDSVQAVGIPAAVGHLCFPSTVWGVRFVQDVSRRTWGVVWGNMPFTQKDLCISSHPHTSYEPKPLVWTQELYSPVCVCPPYSGVYVKDAWREYFIVGAVVQSADEYEYRFGAVYYERELVLEEDEFVPEAYPRDPLTERQLELMEGNEDLYPYVRSPFTGLASVTDIDVTYGLGMVSVNCGGEIYPIVMERKAGTSQSGGFTYDIKYTGQFTDWGIFTKDNTGVNEDNEVDADTIEPVYVYCLIMSDPLKNIPSKVIFGMILDGKHYKTDEYSYENYRVVMPELDSGYGTPFVRAAAKRFENVIKEEVEYAS